MRKFAAPLLCICFLLVVSCASQRQFESIERYAAKGDFEGARQELEQEKNKLYANTDEVLYLLDSGLLAHYAQEYPQSNTNLSDAEKLIFDYYAKSVSQAIGSAIINDNVIDYSGEDYEDVYVNVFMALNYIHLNKIEDAMVEIRRFEIKLKALSVKYREQILAAQSEAKQTDSPSYELQFTNSAFARYLSMILYRSQGEVSPAEVDLKFIRSAFETQPQLYNFTPPANLDENIFYPEDKTRLHFVSFTGLSPIKEEDTLRLPFEATYFKLALPIMVRRSSPVSGVIVTISNQKDSEEPQTIRLDLIESIENIVIDTFKQHQSLIYFKTLARATVKAAASGAFGTVAAESDDSNMSLLFSLLDFGSRIFTETTEQADTRISRFFPANVYTGGITLDPGVYSITVQYIDARGRVLYTEDKENIPVHAGKTLNLIESCFLQ